MVNSHWLIWEVTKHAILEILYITARGLTSKSKSSHKDLGGRGLCSKRSKNFPEEQQVSSAFLTNEKVNRFSSGWGIFFFPVIEFEWRASLVAQWLRTRLPMQGTRVQALVGKIPHAPEQLSRCTTTTEPAL